MNAERCYHHHRHRCHTSVDINYLQMNDDTLNHAFFALIIVSHMKQQVPGQYHVRHSRRLVTRRDFVDARVAIVDFFCTPMIEANDGLIRMIVISEIMNKKKKWWWCMMSNCQITAQKVSTVRAYTLLETFTRPATGEIIIISAHNRHIKYCFAVLRARARSPCIRRQ